MNIEQLITALITALEANTAAHSGTATAASAPAAKAEKPAAAKAEKPAAAKKAQKHSFDDVKAACVKMMDVIGKPETKAVILEVGKAKELAAVKESEFDALFEATTAAVELALSSSEDNDDESSGL